MKTQQEQVMQTLTIFAVPKQEWEMTEESDFPFKYEISTNESHWRKGAIELFKVDYSFTIPEGIELLNRAVATLEEAKAEVRKNMYAELDKIQKQINNLLALDNKSKDDDNNIIDINL